MFKTILLAYDGSPDAKRALSVASDLARAYGARLIVVHARMRDAGFDLLRKLANRRRLRKTLRDELYGARSTRGSAPAPDATPSLELIEAVGQQLIEQARASAQRAGVRRVTAVLLPGDAGDVILHHAARTKADLIVMGSLGFGNLRSVVLGTVSHKVSSRATCSCLTVR